VAHDHHARRLAAEQRLLRLLEEVEPLDVEPGLVASMRAIEPRPASIAFGWGE
jgi:hypothetical protein